MTKIHHFGPKRIIQCGEMTATIWTQSGGPEWSRSPEESEGSEVIYETYISHETESDEDDDDKFSIFYCTDLETLSRLVQQASEAIRQLKRDGS